MSSYSQSTNVSSSSPIETPENQLIDQLSSVAAGLAQQMNSWAQQEFAQTSAVTDAAVGNFFNASQQMMGLAGNMTSQYNTLFAPENAQLVADANSYASTSRMQTDMGMAGATQAQAGDAAIKNSEQNLVSMGIDPSSGRYAALDEAAAVQNAANVAGAENLQRNADIQTGQNLRSQAVQVGAQLPSAIANTTNTAIQANTGASNASLANANTGANLNSLADKYLQTAMGIKLPPNATFSSGQSNSNSSKPSTSSGAGGNPSGAPGGASGAGGQSGYNGMWTNPGAAVGSAGGKASPGAKTSTAPGGGGNDWGSQSSALDQMYNGSDSLGGVDYSQWTGDNNIYQPSGDSSMSIGQGDGVDNNYDSNPFNDSGFGQTYDYGGADQTFGNMSGGTDTQFGNISYDPSANQPTTDMSGWGDYSTPDTSSYDSSGNSSSVFDTGSSDSYSSDYSDYSSGGDDSGYAAGGSVQGGQGGPPMKPTTGGFVSPQASPSGGRHTDDVRANLNSGEFVIPKDVAAWKGQEFFHKLIAQSRKIRATSPVGGKPVNPALAKGPPTFHSRPLQQGR